MEVMTPRLLHGPAAESHVPNHAHGRIVWRGEPKKEALRDMLGELLGSLTTGGPVYAVIGPFENVARGAADLLLKSLEELDSNKYRFVLWTREIESVPMPVRSRCLEQYCFEKQEDEHWDEALRLYEAYMKDDWATVSALTSSSDLVQSFVHVLAVEGNTSLWALLREELLSFEFDGDNLFEVLLRSKRLS